MAERIQVTRFGLADTNSLINEEVYGKGSDTDLRSTEYRVRYKTRQKIAKNLHVGGLSGKTKDTAVLFPEWALVVMQSYVLHLFGKGILCYFR